MEAVIFTEHAFKVGSPVLSSIAGGLTQVYTNSRYLIVPIHCGRGLKKNLISHRLMGLWLAALGAAAEEAISNCSTHRIAKQVGACKHCASGQAFTQAFHNIVARSGIARGAALDVPKHWLRDATNVALATTSVSHCTLFYSNMHRAAFNRRGHSELQGLLISKTATRSLFTCAITHTPAGGTLVAESVPAWLAGLGGAGRGLPAERGLRVRTALRREGGDVTSQLARGAHGAGPRGRGHDEAALHGGRTHKRSAPHSICCARLRPPCCRLLRPQTAQAPARARSAATNAQRMSQVGIAVAGMCS